MRFVDFCKLHGVLIDWEPPIGIWKRYPTEDKPMHRNGAVCFMGTHGHVQNWATMTEPETWHADGDSGVDPNKARKAVEAAHRDIRDRQEKAAKNAAHILHQCQIGFHPYLASKGFKDEQGHVWKTPDGLKLVIPMRVGHHLVGCQIINEDSSKKFLYGQRTSGAAFTFDNKGPNILCEGYVTALSIKAAMKALKRRYTLHVCFSAGNMKKVADTLPGGFVVADNDASVTGERTAREIGWPYWMPDAVGMDANDIHQRDGLFAFSQSLGKVIL
jgi:putative DNA primase/helicase